MAWNKPIPSIDEDSKPFWEGLKRHEFLLFRCKTCGAWYFPKAFCRNHDNEPLFGNLEWAKSSGRGKIFAYNIHNVAFHPGYGDDVPYVQAMIELDEGPMFGTQIVGCEPPEVKVGMPVEVVFMDVPDKGFTVPYFQPTEEG